MPGRNEVRRPRRLPPADGPTGGSADRTQAEIEIDNINVTLPEGVVMTLERFLEGSADREYCEDVAGADFSIPAIKAKYGGGRYVGWLRKPNPDNAGQMLPAGSKRFRIAGPPIAGGAAPAMPSAAGPGVFEATKLLSTYADLVAANLKTSLDGQQMLQTMQMAALKAVAESGSGGGSAIMLEVVKAIAPALVTVLAGGRRGSELSPEFLLQWADKLAARSSPMNGVKDILELAEHFRNMGGDDTPAWVPVAAKGLDTIARMIESQGARGGAESIPPDPGPRPAPAPATTESRLPSTAHALFRYLEPHVPMLIRHAEADHDPTTYAGVIFDGLEPGYFLEVQDYVGRPDFPDLLEAAFPDTARLRKWFGELRADLLARLHEALAPAGDGETPDA